MDLPTHGIQKGATMTSYPRNKEKIEDYGYTWSDQRVVIDGKSITSQGPGTTFDFAFKLVEILKRAEEAKKLSDFLLL